MKKLILFILLIPNICHAGWFFNSIASGTLTCSGNWASGQYESFEKGAGEFCTTGWTETDTEGVIDTYNTEQSVCGTHSLKLTRNTTTASYVVATIPDNDLFSARRYFRFGGFGTTTYSTVSFSYFRDSSGNLEFTLGVRRVTGSDYRFVIEGVTTSYFPIAPDTWYYYVVYWNGDGTTNNTRVKLYTLTGTPIAATAGYDGYTLASTENDGITTFEHRTSSGWPTDFYMYIDNAKYSTVNVDLSGGQICD